MAERLALGMLEEYGTMKGELSMAKRLPAGTYRMLKEAGLLPRSIDREIVEAMHRVHMGVGADYRNILGQGVRASLGDGWGGSMIGTETSDVLFGTPQIRNSKVNLGVLKHDHVNISLHGHNPVLSEMVVRRAALPEMKEARRGGRAKGINLSGCAAPERAAHAQGRSASGQPSEPGTGDNHRGAGGDDRRLPVHIPVPAEHRGLLPHQGDHHLPQGQDPRWILSGGHPGERLRAGQAQWWPSPLTTTRTAHRSGCSSPTTRWTRWWASPWKLEGRPGGTLKPLLDLILEGKIRGAVGIVGCNNPKIKQDYGHITLAKELIRRNIMVVETGCAPSPVPRPD